MLPFLTLGVADCHVSRWRRVDGTSWARTTLRVSCWCWQLPFPCLRAAAGGFPASEVLLEVMQQRFVAVKHLISSPAGACLEEGVSCVLLESGHCSC